MSLIEELLELLKEVDENPFMGKYTSLWIELKKIVQKSMSHATSKPLDASNGRRIPVESRSDSERDRPMEKGEKE